MTCRSCGGPVRAFIDFGQIPLGNAFVRAEDFETEKRFKLELGLCEGCKLVQQTSPPPPQSLAEDYRNYAYVPVGATLDRHYQQMATDLTRELGIGRSSFVLDIGSNNGLLLNYLRANSDCRILGIEPAVKISEMARKAGVPTITSFFDIGTAEEVKRLNGSPDVVTVTQVLQHIPSIGQFLDDIKSVIKQGGVLVVEGRYFGVTVEKGTYDTVYHEMMYFFTLWSLRGLLERHGFQVFRAEMNEIYGGSLRVCAKSGSTNQDASVSKLAQRELTSGLTTFEKYSQFKNQVSQLRTQLRSAIHSVKSEGKTIAGYGAPSTSATLLNFCGISNADVRYVVDDNPLKQGLFTPGTHIPIVPSGSLDSEPPDYLLLLAWRLRDEILAKVRKHRDAGMKVIVPLPMVEVI